MMHFMLHRAIHLRNYAAAQKTRENGSGAFRQRTGFRNLPMIA
jgi:hypothetical protein